MARHLLFGVEVALALVGCASAPVPRMVVDRGVCTPAPAHVDLGVPPSTAHRGKVVALLRSTGTPPVHGDLRPRLEQTLGDEGFTVVPVALDLEGAAARVRCDSQRAVVPCLGRIAGHLAAQPPDFVIATRYREGRPGTMSIVAYDVHGAAIVRELVAQVSAGDLVLPEVLGRATAGMLIDHVTPPPAATEAEREILAEVAHDPSLWAQRVALVEPPADAPMLSWRRDDIVVEMPLDAVLDDLRSREDYRLLLLVQDVREHGPALLGSAWTHVLATGATPRLREQQTARSLCPRDAHGGCRTTDVELHGLVGRMLDRGTARVYRCGEPKARWIDVEHSPAAEARAYSDLHGDLLRVAR